MKKIISMMIVLAMLTAVPLSAMAQIAEPEPMPEFPVDPNDPWVGNYTIPFLDIVEPGFNYTDGVANGWYVDFLLDETTGTVSDYTTTLMDYNYFYLMIYYGSDDRMNGTEAGYYPPDYYYPEPTQYTVEFFESIALDGFVPNGHPMTLGQSLYFMGENVLATFSDYECSGLYYQFGDDNSTMTLTVPDGIVISEYPRYYELYDIEPGNMTAVDYAGASGDASVPNYDMMVPTNIEQPWYYQWDEAYLTAGNVTCSLWVNFGSLEIDGNQIIIHTYPGATVSTSTYIDYGWTYEYAYKEPWFEDIPSEDDKGAIETAIQNGQMAAVGYLYSEEGGAQYSDSSSLNDPTFELKFMNVEENRFQVQVDSDIETGRIVTLNVNKESLEAENMREVKVLLDNEDVRACDSMEELVDMQGGAGAGYYMVSGTSQNTIFVYVPHFSTHIITVGLDTSQIMNVILPGAIAVGFIAIAVGLVVLRGKRNKDSL